MADLVIIVPSRGRPQAAREVAQAFASTCVVDTRLVLAVDEDDPMLPEYSDIPRSWFECSKPVVNLCICDAPGTMVTALNGTALAELRMSPQPFAVGFMGDDHRPRTVGWDKEYLDALQELRTGIVYGNDLYQGQRVPTQCAMTSDIVRALGHMAPSTLHHLYVDNYWRDLGSEADCLTYLPDVVIEHMHPAAGKAELDDGYIRVNHPKVYDADSTAYGDYHIAGRFAADVAKVLALRGAA